MIKLFSQRILVATDDGQFEALDVDALKKDLEESFHTVGVHEEWLAEQFVIVLEEQAAEAEHAGAAGGDQSQPAGRREIDLRLAKLLVDAGFPDVAAEFSKRRDVQWRTPPPATRAPWSPGRVSGVLKNHLPLSPHVWDELGEYVLRRLESLGLARVSDDLIRMIADHILEDLANLQRQAATDNSGWLMPPSYWNAYFHGAIAELIHDGVLTIHNISSLFPVIRVTFDLARLGHRRTDAPLTELAFLPYLQESAALVREALDELYRKTAAIDGSANRPAHLRINGLQSLVTKQFGELRKSRAEMLEQEIIGIVERHLMTGGRPRIIVSLAS